MYFVAHDIMGRTSRNRLQGESSSTWLEGDDMDQVRIPGMSLRREAAEHIIIIFRSTQSWVARADL